jgi:cyclohexyl-isocyanide hydratase
MTIGMLLFDNLTQLDLTGPYEVFIRLPNAQVTLVSPTLAPVMADGGMRILPDITCDEAPQYDILFVPGGYGTSQAMQNETIIHFLKKQGKQARYITSVCTGALLLGAAGLLRGYQATTHWLSLDLLPLFEAQVVDNQRVVMDRNRITGGGVTAGIDFGLALAAAIYGDDIAKEIQLMMEYNPQPPFNCGSPNTCDLDILNKIKKEKKEVQEKRKDLILSIIEKDKLLNS